MTGDVDYSDFPTEIQHLIDSIAEEDFEIIYGDVEDGKAFIATDDERKILVSDAGQTWFVTFRTPDSDDVEECWDRPPRVRSEVEDWLQDCPE